MATELIRETRRHPSDHMTGLGEFRGTTEPVAVVIRPDGSIDAYGNVAVIDQRAVRAAQVPQVYSLTDVRLGTGWPRGARFTLVNEA